jgi:hypothetical protein
VENPPPKPAVCQGVGGGGRYEWRLGLAHFHNENSFLMISPNLYDIWPLFLLIPSPPRHSDIVGIKKLYFVFVVFIRVSIVKLQPY